MSLRGRVEQFLDLNDRPTPVREPGDVAARAAERSSLGARAARPLRWSAASS